MLKYKAHLVIDMFYMIPVPPLSTPEGQNISEWRHKKLPSSNDSDRNGLR